MSALAATGSPLTSRAFCWPTLRTESANFSSSASLVLSSVPDPSPGESASAKFFLTSEALFFSGLLSESAEFFGSVPVDVSKSLFRSPRLEISGSAGSESPALVGTRALVVTGHFLLTTASTPAPTDESNSLAILIGALLGAIVLIFIIVVVLIVLRMAKSSENPATDYSPSSQSVTDIQPEHGRPQPQLIRSQMLRQEQQTASQRSTVGPALEDDSEDGAVTGREYARFYQSYVAGVGLP
jgi:hypothetical protein